MIGRLSTFVRIPAWHSYVALAYRSLPTKCIPWFAFIIESYCDGFAIVHHRPSRARVSLILSKYPTWCQSIFEPCRHDFTVPLCTQPVRLSKGMPYPIAPMIKSVWKLLPQWAMPSLMLEFEKVLFHLEHPTKKSGIDDREDLLLSTVLIPGIILATWSMHRSSFLVSPLSKSWDKISFKGEDCNTPCYCLLNSFIKS
jgi:hypothetical protein